MLALGNGVDYPDRPGNAIVEGWKRVNQIKKCPILKRWLRFAAEKSAEAVWQRIGSLLETLPPHECADYLRNSGYAAS